MKTSTIISTALLTASLTMGVATQASAMAGNNTFTLESGNTPSRLVPIVDHYRFEVDNPGHLSVTSHLWSPGAATGRMRAQLVDGSGRVVARAQSNGKGFVLNQSLQPGSYTLQVDGSTLGGRKETSQRYYLKTDLR